ncbi:SGNH/GDSL hydrolase family protein [Bacillus cereus group sp. BfR-BA-01422]|uniref:SGNH/GDSL hydrolase family protein n=1 Tax=Bacillus cereus group sp. BfR-BA-01422 TaxID=2920339 RepID=UPI001F5A7F7F|nr:SGNH/GDSL hydrolase family protein [Bacillus cereus group sp. BfR-BA-01422]
MNCKKVATISIALNMAVLLVGGYFIYSSVNNDDKKVVESPEHKIESTEISSSTSDNNSNERERSPSYKVRTSIFNKATSVDTGVVFLGDSITNFNEWGEAFPYVKTYNRGISGDTTVGVMKRLNQVVALNPSKIFIMIGINDLGAKTPKEEILKNYNTILEKMKSELPDTKIFVESILPTKPLAKSKKLSNEDINWLNKELERVAKENGSTFINLHSLFIDKDGELKGEWTVDGVHITGEGYKTWENEIKKYIYR